VLCVISTGASAVAVEDAEETENIAAVSRDILKMLVIRDNRLFIFLPFVREQVR
jgi:hypothetical protein